MVMGSNVPKPLSTSPVSGWVPLEQKRVHQTITVFKARYNALCKVTTTDHRKPVAAAVGYKISLKQRQVEQNMANSNNRLLEYSTPPRLCHKARKKAGLNSFSAEQYNVQRSRYWRLIVDRMAYTRDIGACRSKILHRWQRIEAAAWLRT
jgi:hypothetical protein